MKDVKEDVRGSASSLVPKCNFGTGKALDILILSL